MRHGSPSPFAYAHLRRHHEAYNAVQARRDGHDEPFAWAAREFLRRKAIGQASFVSAPRQNASSELGANRLIICSDPLQPCTFRVDYTLPTAPGLEFGTVFIGNENLALLVVSAGWAKVCNRTATHVSG
jgi:staphylococcal nuclease domain-containing protein 1